jgi:FkbM family methyltransferase
MFVEQLINEAAICAKYLRIFGVMDGIAKFMQTRVRLIAGPVTRIRPPGSRLRVALRGGTSDVDVFEQVFVRLEYEGRHLPQWRALERKYQDLLHSGRRPVIVDCGANVGMASVYFHSVFPEATIVAIEPEPGNFGILKSNCLAFPRITPVHAAVSDRAGAMRLANPGAANWAFQFERTGVLDEGVVEAITIADALTVVKDGELLIVKVDIEGAEEHLFRATDWASRAPLVIVELHDWMKPWAGSSHSFLRTIASGHYDVAPRGSNLFAFNWDALRDFASEAAAQCPRGERS